MTKKPKAYLHVGAEKPQVSHTPTPWKIDLKKDLSATLIIDLEENHIASVLDSVDAAFIIRAVNAHEELVIRLKEILHEASKPKYLIEIIRAAAREALAEAKGGK